MIYHDIKCVDVFLARIVWTWASDLNKNLGPGLFQGILCEIHWMIQLGSLDGFLV